MPLILTLNGQQRSFDDFSSGSDLAALVADLGLKSDRIALELNGQIVARAAWVTTLLADGDRLELVHFVGGGTETGSQTAINQDAFVSSRNRLSQ